MSYDSNVERKIMQKTDIGNYNYDGTKIHQLKYLTAISGGANPAISIGTNERNISYTSFLKTQTISENGYELTYTYGSDQQRLTSTLKQAGSIIETKTYWGDMEILTKAGVTTEIYYISGPTGLSNIIVKKSGTITKYNAYTDQLGSIIAVTQPDGTIVAEQNFDAWGRYRNPANWRYTGVPARPDWLYRGFTGHEHLAAFTLINMNGRMYDPMTGMMLSPDNYVPMPFSPGGYNRYLYANGNPLKFVDPTGWITEKEFEQLWDSPYGGTWNETDGVQVFNRVDEAFGYGAGQMTQNNWWGGGGNGSGWAGSPGEALGRFNAATGTSGITPDMWNGYMAAQYSGYGYNFFTSGVYSLKRGDGFLTSGLTFANAELGSSFVQYSSYSYAEKVFLSWSLPGLTALEKANIIMGVSTISLGAQSELFDYAVRSSFKSANSWYAYNQLRGTQKAWRQMAILGKDGATLRNGMNVLGKGVFAIQATVSGYSAIPALASNDANKWGVSGKAALDITIGAISVWGGPVGWVAGGLYFIGGAAGWWGDWGKPAGHP